MPIGSSRRRVDGKGKAPAMMGARARSGVTDIPRGCINLRRNRGSSVEQQTYRPQPDSERMMAIGSSSAEGPIRPGTGSSAPKLFSAAPNTPIRPVASFDVSPDGQRFLFLRETTPTDRNELIVVQNWVEEMKARAGR